MFKFKKYFNIKLFNTVLPIIAISVAVIAKSIFKLENYSLITILGLFLFWGILINLGYILIFKKKKISDYTEEERRLVLSLGVGIFVLVVAFMSRLRGIV